jgi:hypothetical protein
LQADEFDISIKHSLLKADEESGFSQKLLFEELIFVKNFRFTCASLENFCHKNQLRVQFQENTDFSEAKFKYEKIAKNRDCPPFARAYSGCGGL